jgi:hypothetical protein
MKKRALLIMILFALFLAACNGDPVEEEEPTARPTPTTETVAPTLEGDGYPAQPQPTDPAAAYPAAGEAQDLVEGWVVLPAGEQCADNLAYPTSDTAVAELEAAGLTPLAVEETELLVCEACGCPTSAHYRVLLSPEDMAIALSLGWQREG